jgi:hypothetical protein
MQPPSFPWFLLRYGREAFLHTRDSAAWRPSSSTLSLLALVAALHVSELSRHLSRSPHLCKQGPLTRSTARSTADRRPEESTPAATVSSVGNGTAARPFTATLCRMVRAGPRFTRSRPRPIRDPPGSSIPNGPFALISSFVKVMRATLRRDTARSASAARWEHARWL